MLRLRFALIVVALVTGALSAQDARLPATQPATTQPATTPTTRPDTADDVLDRLLAPTTRPAQSAPALPPQDRSGAPNNATGLGAAAVAPDTPRQPLVAEGTYVVDRLVRARPSVDRRGLELVFVADGEAPEAAVEPPMLAAPNLNLMSLEAAIREEPERLFRVTGRVTEYRGRNYLLLEKVVFVR